MIQEYTFKTFEYEYSRCQMTVLLNSSERSPAGFEFFMMIL